MEDIFSKEFVTADGNSFANKEHLNNIACIFSSLLSNALSKASATFNNPLKSVSTTGNG